MSIAHHLVATRWADQINEGPCALSMKGTNVVAYGDKIDSYGWWEMGRIVRDKRERPIFFLLNGDRYSPSTTQHQGNVRGAAQGAARTYEEKSGRQFPVLIVPYTALDAAGVAKDSITPLEIRPDRYVPYEASANELPEYATPIEGRDDAWQVLAPGGEYAEITFRDGKYRWTDRTHRLGDSLFSALITEHRSRPLTDEECDWYKEVERLSEFWRAESPPEDVEKAYAALRAKRDEHPDLDVYEASGELRARYTITKRVKYLSSFDYQERSAPYFLCELPRTAATTVEEAYAALVPEPVRLAQESGVEVIRQGDIFAIPTGLSTRELTALAKPVKTPTEGGGVAMRTRLKREFLLRTNHTASEVIVTKDGETYARGTLRHEPGTWRSPDHARRKMSDGRTWHRIIKNTVPLDKSHYRGGGGGANQSGQSRAWTLGGAVD